MVGANVALPVGHELERTRHVQLSLCGGPMAGGHAVRGHPPKTGMRPKSGRTPDAGPASTREKGQGEAT